MTDIIDRAQEIETFARDRALERVLGKAHERGPDDLVACVDCGDAIEMARREAQPGALRCVDCAAALERRPKLFGKG